MYKQFHMRETNKNESRNFEIRQWYYGLYKYYLKQGLTSAEASENAYEDTSIRFCLKKGSIRKAKNQITRPSQNFPQLMLGVKSNLNILKKAISKLEETIGES